MYINNSGHPGGSLGVLNFLWTYFDIMNHNKNCIMDGIGEDIFFLSNGHISRMVLSFAQKWIFPNF